MFSESPKKSNLTVELDADSLVYRIGGIMELEDKDHDFCIRLIEETLTNIYEDTGCSKCNIYLGTDTNYRKTIATLYEYKGNRKDKKRPQYYDAIRTYLIKKCNAILVDYQEAEDAVGIACYKYNDYKDFMVGAIDKDMRMIAGYHYNYVKRTIDFVDKVQALRNFYLQLVTGDMTDNIPGLYHQLLIDGEEELAYKFRYSRYKSKLIKVLDECTTECDMFEAAISLYKEYGQIDKHGYKRILEVGRLLWIRRLDGEMWNIPSERKIDYIQYDDRENIDAE